MRQGKSRLRTCLEIAMVGPLSLWERARVRAGRQATRGFPGGSCRPHPPPLSRKRERGDISKLGSESGNCAWRLPFSAGALCARCGAPPAAPTSKTKQQRDARMAWGARPGSGCSSIGDSTPSRRASGRGRRFPAWANGSCTTRRFPWPSMSRSQRSSIPSSSTPTTGWASPRRPA